MRQLTDDIAATLTTTKFIKYLSIGVFLFSLLCPCYDTEKDTGGLGQGAQLLAEGTCWFIYASPGFVWLANPLLLFSWINVEKNTDKSFIFSMVSFFIAICFLFFKDMLTDESGANSTPIIAHRSGYWLWLLSIAIMLLGNLYVRMIGQAIKKSPAGWVSKDKFEGLSTMQIVNLQR